MAANPSVPFWDLFCKVVDNYGDAGVCWRIARQLAHEHGLPVRLWIDQPATLQALHPQLEPDRPAQTLEGVDVRDWSKQFPDPASTAVVVEAFGCGLPDTYVSAMAAQTKPPLWIVLDYLSAEPWVDTHHGLASPHPSLGLPRWYFYPGFTSSTGGLPRERDLLVRRDAFDEVRRNAFWEGLGFTVPDRQALVLSLFAYADAPVANWLDALSADAQPTVLAVPAGAVLPVVQAFFRHQPGPVWRRGGLEVRRIPFLPQAAYDELLWACDINFVRGEDSFVRAQWAAKPMIWQPYRQEEGAHRRKLEAFLQRYGAGLEPPAKDAVAAFAGAWSAGAPVGALWPALRAHREEWTGHARRWARELAGLGELSTQLVEFVRNKVK